jgi:archaellum component FlaG (FlaF/FlaG flagellin family)
MDGVETETQAAETSMKIYKLIAFVAALLITAAFARAFTDGKVSVPVDQTRVWSAP